MNQATMEAEYGPYVAQLARVTVLLCREGIATALQAAGDALPGMLAVSGAFYAHGILHGALLAMAAPEAVAAAVQAIAQSEGQADLGAWLAAHRELWTEAGGTAGVER